jgi:hypothetical protein
MNWLPRAMHLLRDELKNIQVTISPDLAEALVRRGACTCRRQMDDAGRHSAR